MYNKQEWKDEIPDLTKPIYDANGKQKTDPQTGRPLFELVQVGTRITSTRLNNMESGIEAAHTLVEQLGKELGGNFVVAIDGTMGLLCTAQGLKVTWTAGIAYVGGRRYQVTAGEMSLNPTQGQYLYVDVDGVVKKTTSQATAKSGLSLFYVATDTSGVISNADQRVNISLEEIIKRMNNVQIPDASLTQQGKVQLTNATNSTSETLAATAKAVNDARQAAITAAAADATTKANTAEANAKGASLPRSGGRITGRLTIQSWSSYSAGTNGNVVMGQNCYLHPTDGTFRFENNHPNMGARGIYMTYTKSGANRVFMFDTGLRETVQDDMFTPVLKEISGVDAVTAISDSVNAIQNIAPNMIKNSTGMIGLSGWTSLTSRKWGVSDNTKFVKEFRYTGAMNAYETVYLLSDPISVTPAYSYYLSAELLKGIGTLEVELLAAGTNAFIGKLGLGATNGSWQRLGSSFTIPSNVSSVTVRLTATNSGTVFNGTDFRAAGLKLSQGPMSPYTNEADTSAVMDAIKMYNLWGGM